MSYSLPRGHCGAVIAREEENEEAYAEDAGEDEGDGILAA